MDIEFHYYMTYLIAARAGFAPGQALVIAHAAQSVDDNHIQYRISGGAAAEYLNYVSQTMDILKPTNQLLRIYPIFHFIPGDENAPSAQRADGFKDPWVTTPDSPVAGKMIDAALASGDLYRIGVSAHGYVDTWAHQNFIGRRDTYNNLPMESLIDEFLNVGHGSAGHQPDHPALVWTDTRLASPVVDNRSRFLDAAEALFRKFALHLAPDRAEASLAAHVAGLRNDLGADIGPQDPNSEDDLRAARLARYQQRALQSEYGGVSLATYDEYAWFNAAVAEEGATLRQKIDGFLSIAADYLDQTDRVPCNWQDPTAYQTTDWYRFVEAVKVHQNSCWSILVAEQLPYLDDPRM